MMPAGVQGRNVGVPSRMLPALTAWNASTSFFGSMAAMTARSDRWEGSGSWHKMPSMSSLLLSAFTVSMSVSCDTSAGRVISSE